MVINGEARARPVPLALHLQRTDTNERVHVREIWGCASENLYDALREIHDIGKGAKSERTLYHANIDWRVDEEMTDEQKNIAVRRLAEKLRMQDQPRVVVEHVKDGREHLHVVFGRIDLVTMTAIPDSHNFRKHEELATELAREFGHAAIRRALTRDKEREERPPQAPSFREYQQSARAGMTPQEAKALVSEMWRVTTTGHDFMHRLEAEGFSMARGDRRDFVLVDVAGGVHSLTRRIEGAKAKDVRERMADVDLDQLPDVAESKRLMLLRQAKVNAFEFTSAADRLRAEEVEREAEAKGGMFAKLNSTDQDIADALYQLAKTSRGQLETVIVGKPNYEQRKQVRAELAVRPEMEAEEVRYQSGGMAANVPAPPAVEEKAQVPEATAGGHQAPPVERKDERPIAAAPEIQPVPVSERQSLVPPEPVKASLLYRLLEWVRPQPEQRQHEQGGDGQGQGGETQVQQVRKKAEPIQQKPQSEVRPSATLFGRIFGQLIEAYQRAHDRAKTEQQKPATVDQEKEATPAAERETARQQQDRERQLRVEQDRAKEAAESQKRDQERAAETQRKTVEDAKALEMERRPPTTDIAPGKAPEKQKAEPQPRRETLYEQIMRERAARTPQEKEAAAKAAREAAQRLREQEDRDRRDRELKL